MKVPVQPSLNIGLVGHVDHGKTQLCKGLTGEWTDRHSEEIRRGISIRLGYADTAFYRCPNCEEPQCYGTSPTCKTDGSEAELIRAVSFVDSPGHETLMATMLSGAAIMNGALLIVAANEDVPQPQTKEHLMALSIIGVEKIVIVQNKIDLVSEDQARANYEQIRAFTKNTIAEDAPIVPVSAHHDVNLDVLIKTIVDTITPREHDEAKPPKMFVARSFDVNHPGTPPDKLLGGVLGGTLLQGVLRIGGEIEIGPGRPEVEGTRTDWVNLSSVVRSLHSGGDDRKEVHPGGLIAVGTNLDPSLTKSDSLVGRVAGEPGTLPPTRIRLTVQVNLLERVVGTTEDLEVEPIKTNEPLMLSVGTATTIGIVTSARADTADLNLKIPVCAETGQRLAVSRRIGGKWRLIGFGVLE